MQYLLITLVTLLSTTCQGYEKLLELYNSKLHNPSYSTTLRPVRDQRRPINVSISVMLYSIVAVDDVSQSFKSNVFFNFLWRDEFMTWDPSDVENETMIYPGLTVIWIPRFSIVNILQDDTPFKDEHPPLVVFYDGKVALSQSGLMTTSCSLDMTYYPFDELMCTIHLSSMSLDVTRLVFSTDSPEVSLSLFRANGEWEIQSATTYPHINDIQGSHFSVVDINFMLKRRPSIFIVSIFMPLVALSLLNVLIFLIPVDSGEKISYGITVLLAPTVLMSSVTGILPRSSNSLPYITMYVFILIALAVLTVIVSIVVVFLHHVTEYDEKSSQDNIDFSMGEMTTKFSGADLSPGNTSSTQHPAASDIQQNHSNSCCRSKPQNSKALSKRVNAVALVISLITWFVLTLGFLIKMSL